MVDSRQKGARAETLIKDILRKHTKHNWQRTPMSGGLHEAHGLKGDLYIPNCKQVYCVEVKHYKDDHLTSKILTSKDPQWFDWWKQTVREAGQVSREPILIYKFDRSKNFVAFEDEGLFMSALDEGFRVITINLEDSPIYNMKLDDFLKLEITWVEV